MDLTQKSRPSHGLRAGSFFPYLSENWIVILTDIYGLLRQVLHLERQKGMYEILDYDSTLELVDSKGETAIFKRREQVKFLHNNIIAFEDYAWGDGEIFADYRCSPR